MEKQILPHLAVGADPEVFFSKDSKPYPAIGLVGGTKQKPKKRNIGYIQEDNVMAEFNIPPATTAQEFVKYIGIMLRQMNLVASSRGYGVLITPWAEFDYRMLDNLQAQEIGCEGDFNAWSRKANPKIGADLLGNIRVAAGHVHINIPEEYHIIKDFREKFVRLLDLFIGVPSVILDPDRVRRRFYGMAGAHRRTVYGVEYRVPSNFWIASPHTVQWMFEAVEHVYKIFTENENLKYNKNHIVKCINTYNTDLALKLIQTHKIRTP